MQAFFLGLHIPQTSPIEHVWDMVGRLLIYHGPLATNVDTLWTLIQTVWWENPHEHKHTLFDSMPQKIETSHHIEITKS
jgi:hypothetical protein